MCGRVVGGCGDVNGPAVTVGGCVDVLLVVAVGVKNESVGYGNPFCVREYP
jgi:hypothetical protein